MKGGFERLACRWAVAAGRGPAAAEFAREARARVRRYPIAVRLVFPLVPLLIEYLGPLTVLGRLRRASHLSDGDFDRLQQRLCDHRLSLVRSLYMLLRVPLAERLDCRTTPRPVPHPLGAAKLSTDRAFLPDAVAHGCALLAETRATRIRELPDRVEVTVEGPSGRRKLRCRHLVISGGAIGSTALIRENLQGAAMALESGDLGARAPVSGVQELTSLADSFNRMAERLQRHAQGLEEQVRERTEELTALNAQLKESEGRLRTLVTNAPVVLFALDRTGVFTFVEGNQATGLRLDPGTALGQAVRDVYREFPDVLLEFERALSGETASAIVVLGGAAFEIRFSPVHDPAGHVTGVARLIGVATDITERKRLEDELKEQYEKLKTLDRLKSQFVSAVSHDLRTPLTTIRGYAEFLEDEVGGTLTREQTTFVKQIQLGTGRLERLVDDLLDFARIEAGTFRLSPVQADLGEKIEEIAESLRPQAEEARVDLVVKIPEALPQVRMDPQRIGQVVTNFLANAIKFTPPGGRIELKAARSDGTVVCEVSDSGIGIAREDLPRLFRRFSQLEAGLHKGGTGLGLSISKSIVEAHGGTIGVTSKLGEGSTFWFMLPGAGPVG